MREYIRVVLKEDDGYGDIMSAAVGMNPFGVSFGSDDDLSKIFIKPFTDVVDTALGKTKEITTKALGLAHVALVGAITTVIPTLKSNYAKIFEKQHAEIDKIRKEFGPVYQSNWDALRDNDVLGVAFCYSPVAVLTAKLVSKSPAAAGSLISSLSGGRLDRWVDRVRMKFKYDAPQTGLGADFKSPHSFGDESGGGGIGMESLRSRRALREKGGEEKGNDEKKKQKLIDLFTSDKLKQELEQSPVVKEMEQRARALVNDTLNAVYKQAQGVLKSNSFQDIQQKSGVRFEKVEAALAKIPQQERQKAEQAILAATKQSIKEFYQKNIEGLVKQAIDAGVPENSPYVEAHRGVLAKIKAL